MEETTVGVDDRGRVVDVQAPIFDPTQIDLNSPNINPVFARSVVDGEAKNSIRINWRTNYGFTNDHESNQRPAWADLPIDERVYLELPNELVQYITRSVLQQPNRFQHELPCPPYEYTMEEGRLQIKAGPFKKSGTKAEWTEVLERMQSEVENMPDGIDTTDLPDITINIELKASMTHDLSVEMLLDGHEQYDGELFAGDRDELEQALEEALENHEVDDYDIDLTYASVDEITIESNDLDYCMRQVDG
jgi:hypothetical protein